jgi:hypothetical protein
MRPTRPAEGCRGGLRLPRLWRPPAAPSHPGKRRPKINDALLLWRPGLWGSRQASPDPHGLKDASSDPAQLTGWWRRWPQANIGLVTGELAEVLDIDGPVGRAALRRHVPATTCAWTGPWFGPGAAGTTARVSKEDAPGGALGLV